MELYRFHPGTTPLLITVPHAGTYIPPDLAANMTRAGRAVADTDWHVDKLYAFAAALGAGMMVATHSRYVIDLNRSPEGKTLYPGADNTELCPTASFDHAAVYQAGKAPSPSEIERRLDRYWRPYHRRLGAEIEALVKTHGVAVLWEAHSIRGEVTRFFEGPLPDFNLGTGDGTTADSDLADAVFAIARRAQGYSAVLNGRFQGGYTTRAYGKPAAGVHAIQLELSQRTYMDETPPFTYRDDLAARIAPVIEDMLQTAIDWAAHAA